MISGQGRACCLDCMEIPLLPCTQGGAERLSFTKVGDEMHFIGVMQKEDIRIRVL